jgi:DNA-directed RNA polymerase subunit RPC12/RpoP
MLPKTRKNTISKIKVPHAAIVRAPGLLPMFYTISELAQELQVPQSIIKSWIRAGLSIERDHRKHIFINGRKLANWIKKVREMQKPTPNPDISVAFCFKCRSEVGIDNPRLLNKSRYVLLKAICPHCGAKVNRGISHDQSQELHIADRIS